MKQNKSGTFEFVNVICIDRVFFSFFSAFCSRNVEKYISTSIRSVQHPNAGQNIQHTQPKTCVFFVSGEYSCLSVDLVFKRQFSYYMITIYVPGCMLVIVSWVSFWLDPHAVPARVALGVTTLLTMSTQTASINNSLPPVAYTKAIDVWQVKLLKDLILWVFQS